jgi:glycosyltransferase involved in cell wall biosynthesis
MRVAMVTPVYPPYKGGIGSVAEAQTNALQALGHDVQVFSPNSVKALFSYGNASVTPRLFFALKNFDIIHLHYPCYGMDVFAALASVVWRTPLVLTYHMKTKTGDWRNIIFSLHRFFIEPMIFAVAKTVFVSTKEYADAAGISHRHLVEMPFGVDTTRFSPGSTFNEDPAQLTAIFVGGLDSAHDFKGVDVLLRAWAELPPSTKLLIVGDGNLRPLYENLAKELKIGSRVEFLGAVSNEELPSVYRRADVHVLPSINRGEAFGLVTLDAAASGLPSIVSDLPGVRTLVEKGQTGYHVEPGNVESLARAFQRFVDHPEDAAIMGAAARVRVMERYDSGSVARSLMTAYNEVIGE